MKKTLIILILCSFSALVNAQDFGKTLISGSINYNQETRESDQYLINPVKATTLSLNPKIGFFLNPNLVVGVLAGYTRYSYTSSNQVYSPEGGVTVHSYKTTGNTYSAGPFIRLYKPIGNNFAFFGQGSASYYKSKSQSENKDTNSTSGPSKHKGGGAEINPGIVFFPNNIIGIELTMGKLGYSSYRSDYNEYGNYSKGSNFIADFGLSSVNLGISLYLGRNASE